MKDIPVIMSAPMVLACLREIERPGTGKTNTRRLLYSERKIRNGRVPKNMTIITGTRRDGSRFHYPVPIASTPGTIFLPTGWQNAKPGDRLWVRETWKPHSLYADRKPRDVPPSKVFYAADSGYAPSNTKWVPCIHMPRWVSRLTLIITATKIEPLQRISEDDARAEGVEREFRTVIADPRGFKDYSIPLSYRGGFVNIWNRLHGAPNAWEDNPFVVAISFRPVLANIDSIEKEAA